ncbi:MAG TPA: MFS transporter, partial [Acidimicrobiales bacterium]|nr:MFS transporter [Acidimicrobiales bacterium]
MAPSTYVAGQGSPAGSGTGRSVGRRWAALIAVCLATLVASVDFMAVSVSLPTTGRALALSFDHLQWALEGPLVAVAAFLLIAGHFADVFGRRPVFVLGSLVFAAGAAVAGSAHQPAVFITGRVVEGVGAAFLYATGSLLLTEIFGPARSRLALGIWGTVTALSVAGAPFVGGIITYELGWRYVYLVDIPAAAVAALIALVFVQEPPRVLSALSGGEDRVAGRGQARRRRADWGGFIFLGGSLAVLVVGLVRTTTAPNLGTFTQNGVIALLASAGLLLILFIAVESATSAPMLPLSLFRRRTFTGSSIAAFGLSAAVLGPFLFLVLYLAYVPGYSAFSIGLRLLLLSGVTLPFLPFSGLLGRFVPTKALIFLGLALVAAGLYLMSRLTVALTWHRLWPGLLVAGIGLELVNPRLAAAAAASVRPAVAAVASRASSMFRQSGAAVGVAVLGALFANRLTNDVGSALTATPGGSGAVPSAVASLTLQGHLAQAARAAVGTRARAMLPVLRSDLADSLHFVLLVAAAVAAASALLALMVRSRDIPRRDEQPQSAATQAAPKDLKAGWA